MASNLRTIVQKRITELRHKYNEVKNSETVTRETKVMLFNRLDELENVMHEAYT
jgi:hypothetical protein